MKIDFSGGEKQELIPADNVIESHLEKIVLKNDNLTEEELEFLKIIMDVQHTEKKYYF